MMFLNTATLGHKCVPKGFGIVVEFTVFVSIEFRDTHPIGQYIFIVTENTIRVVDHLCDRIDIMLIHWKDIR